MRRSILLVTTGICFAVFAASTLGQAPNCDAAKKAMDIALAKKDQAIADYLNSIGALADAYGKLDKARTVEAATGEDMKNCIKALQQANQMLAACEKGPHPAKCGAQRRAAAAAQKRFDDAVHKYGQAVLDVELALNALKSAQRNARNLHQKMDAAIDEYETAEDNFNRCQLGKSLVG